MNMHNWHHHTHAASRKPALSRLAPLAALVALAIADQAGAVSTGTVVGGNAAISKNGTTTTINQNSTRAIINWNNFDIGAGESVNIVQPRGNTSSALLNRVTAGGATQINGNLTANNGQVYVVNPNGIVVGKTGNIVGAGVVLSSLDVNDGDFMSGSSMLTLSKTGALAGAVSNAGNVTGTTYGVTLVGGRVTNEVGGVINTYSGNAQLIAADSVMLYPEFGAMGGADGSRADALVANNGTIKSYYGYAVLQSASRNAWGNDVVSNVGSIDATSVRVDANSGNIRLAGNVTGTNISVRGNGDVNTQGGSLYANNVASIYANGDIAIGQVDAANLDVSGRQVTLSQPINANYVQAKAIDTLKAEGRITAKGGASLSAQNDVTLNAVSSLQNVNIASSAGNVSVNGALSGRNITVSAAGNATLDGNVTANNDAYLSAGNNLTLGKSGAGASVSGWTVGLQSGNDLNVWGRVDARSDASIVSETGAPFVYGGVHSPTYYVVSGGDYYVVEPRNYTPVYGADGYDQYGYDRDGFNRQGYNSGGLDRYARPASYSSSSTLDLTSAPTSLLGNSTVFFGGGRVDRNGQTTTINQNTSKLVLNWDAFGLAQGESLVVNQPTSSSVLLNRVMGRQAAATQIDGSLQANGRVYVINPFGITVGASGVIKANGVMLSALDTSSNLIGLGDAALLTRPPGTRAEVVNNGTIHGGDTGVALVGGKVLNGATGNIESQSGTIRLLSAERVSFGTFDRVNVMNASSNPADGARNDGHISVADGGPVLIQGNTQSASAANGQVTLGKTLDVTRRSFAPTVAIAADGKAL